MFRIIQPTLLLDEARCRQNIRRMAEKAIRNNVSLRPHFKTHQSSEVGSWLAEEGIETITVSSFSMACYFAEAGWKDITVAFPVNILEADRINRLASKITLNVLVEDDVTVARLGKLLKHPVNAFIKVDLGASRTGIDAVDNLTSDKIITAITDTGRVSFKGFLGHAGQTYNCRSHDEIRQVHHQSLGIMKMLADRYRSQYPDIEISVGDTPACSVCENFSPATEIRPGNFVFYDLTQSTITSCQKEDIAVAVACPVVAKHKDRNELVIYGGGIHFSKEFLQYGDGTRYYGEMAERESDGWGPAVEGCYISRLSQEHGILKVTDEVFEGTANGDIVMILPVHSCMTADLMGGYVTTAGRRVDCMDKRKEYLSC